MATTVILGAFALVLGAGFCLGVAATLWALRTDGEARELLARGEGL
jgi:hypothetical protein